MSATALPRPAAGKPTDLDDVVAALGRIERLLEAIAAVNAAPKAVAEADAELMQRILPILGESLGPDGRCFTAREAIEHLQRDGVETGLGVKGLGRAFARCTGVAIAGFRVRRDDKEHGSWRWRVWRV